MKISPERGEIWQVTFEPTIGAEISKTRPALVVSIIEAGRLTFPCSVIQEDRTKMFNHFTEDPYESLRSQKGPGEG